VRNSPIGVTALFGTVLLLAGCEARSVSVDTDPSKTTYSRDVRTNLCFATMGRAEAGTMSDLAKSFSVTNVPCTPEVLALVPEDQRPK
jgi:hypothetical protein